MNKQAIAANITIAVSFILFFVLLIAGMVTMSIAMIITAFVIGFIGYGILEHESSVNCENKENNQ